MNFAIRFSYKKLAIVSVIILSLSVSIILYNTLSDHAQYWLRDFSDSEDINAVALGSSSITSLPLELFDECQGLVKRGFGGGTLKDLLLYLNVNILPSSLKLIIVYAGENDIVYGETIEQTVQRSISLSKRLARHFPEAKLVFIEAKLSPARADHHHRLRTFNQTIEAAIANPRVTIASSALSEHALPELYQTDGVHLKRKGYEIFLEEVPKQC